MEIVSFRNLNQNYCSFYKNTSKYRIDKIKFNKLSVLYGASVFTRKMLRILNRNSLIGTVICVNIKHTRLENLYILAGCLLSGATLLNTNWHTDTEETIDYKIRITGCEAVIQDDSAFYQENNLRRLNGIKYISLYEIFTPAVEEKCRAFSCYLSPIEPFKLSKTDSSIQTMLNYQMKNLNNIPPDTVHYISFSSGTDLEHPRASKIHYHHLRSCYDRLERMGKWSEREPLIMLIANPVYEPFTSILLAYSLYRPNTTLHLLQRYTVTYWKIIWEINEYCKHVHIDSTYKIFTSLYPRQLEALLTLEQVANECNLFDPILEYEYILPVPPNENIEAVSETELEPSQAMDTVKIEDLFPTPPKPPTPPSESEEEMPPKPTQQPRPRITPGMGDYGGLTEKQDISEYTSMPESGCIFNSFSDETESTATGAGRTSMFSKFDFRSIRKSITSKTSTIELPFKSKLKQSFLDPGFKNMNWALPNVHKPTHDVYSKSEKLEKSESSPAINYAYSARTAENGRRSDSLAFGLEHKRSSSYIPKLRMKFSELRNVLADKNVIFSIGGAPICPETCYTFSNVCKGKIATLYYGCTETVFPLIYSASRVRERDELLSVMRKGWMHEYDGVPCKGHYLGHSFDKDDRIRIVKSVDKNNPEFMVECSDGEPGFIVCKANINCELYETRIHEGDYLGLDDVGFYLKMNNDSNKESEDIEYFWMHKIDLSLSENYSWKLRLGQTTKLIHELICAQYELAWNKVYVITFGLMHGNACVFCCAVELVPYYSDPENNYEAKNKVLEEISKDISETLLDQCRKSEMFKNLTIPDILVVGSIPSTYKGTPNLTLLKQSFKKVISEKM